MNPLTRLADWMDARTGYRAALAASPKLKGGASFAYVFGWMLVLLIALEAITGIVLAFYYSPSGNNAWASVAFIEDQLTLGWLIRGVHLHAASALVIICGIHMLQTLVWGAYRRPRELTWWIGILSMVLIMAIAVTGFVLRWDQAGYWASRVEVGIAASTPLLGETIRRVVQAGNEYGNLTVVRFYALHVFVLPALMLALVTAHMMLARKHGPTPRWSLSEAQLARNTSRWPDQTFRNLLAMAICMAAVVGWTITQHGAGLGAPADPSAAYDARPLWFFRWLFELRHLFGSWETAAALGAPGVAIGLLMMMPFIDRSATTAPRQRMVPLALGLTLMAAVTALTMVSLQTDAADPQLAERQKLDDKKAARARSLAKLHGVPIAGGNAVFTTPTMYRARWLYQNACADCHNGDDRKAPEITAGYGNRAYYAAFLKDPSGDRFYGRTKLAKKEEAMQPVELPASEMTAILDWLEAQNGTPIDAAKVAAGAKVFDEVCSDCHSKEAWVAGPASTSLAEVGDKEHLMHFISNPGAAVHFGELNEMPRFDRELSAGDRELVTNYVLWLRSATIEQLNGLEPIE
ncbi:MAG: cytochrome bc complex cytochrome b subunit [Kofleriaceae bacterium]|nr:cytochrome bc complex cytochrome b subunit [Kofleriaceae bacterium]